MSKGELVKPFLPEGTTNVKKEMLRRKRSSASNLSSFCAKLNTSGFILKTKKPSLQLVYSSICVTQRDDSRGQSFVHTHTEVWLICGQWQETLKYRLTLTMKYCVCVCVCVCESEWVSVCVCSYLRKKRGSCLLCTSINSWNTWRNSQ